MRLVRAGVSVRAAHRGGRVQGPELGAVAGVHRHRLRVPGVGDHEREQEGDRRHPVFDSDGSAVGRCAGDCGVA